MRIALYKPFLAILCVLLVCALNLREAQSADSLNAPRRLKVTADPGAGSVNLTWVENNTRMSGYQVERAQGDSRTFLTVGRTREYTAGFSDSTATPREGLNYHVSWLGNSFSGASNRWVQNFFIHTKVQPDGTVNTWSHWDEGGKKFGVYKDGDVIGNINVNPNSLETVDRAGHRWQIAFDYVEPKFHEYDIRPKFITCDGEAVQFPGLFEPMALALANDGELMVADSQTSPRQQVLFYDVTEPTRPRLTRTFGEYGGIASGTPGEVTPTKFWGIRGVGMDAAGNLYVAMSEMGTCLRKFTPDGRLLWELRLTERQPRRLSGTPAARGFEIGSEENGPVNRVGRADADNVCLGIRTVLRTSRGTPALLR